MKDLENGGHIIPNVSNDPDEPKAPGPRKWEDVYDEKIEGLGSIFVGMRWHKEYEQPPTRFKLGGHGDKDVGVVELKEEARQLKKLLSSTIDETAWGFARMGITVDDWEMDFRIEFMIAVPLAKKYQPSVEG